MSKFSVIKFCRHIVSSCGVFGRNKAPKVSEAIITTDDRYPFTSRFVPTNTLKAIHICAVRSSIAVILKVGARPKIVPPIVQRIVVSMISFFFWFTPKNHTVHFNMLTSFLPVSIKTLSRFLRRRPIPLIQPFKISSVYNRVLVSCQRNKAVGCIERLSNRVSLHAIFGSHRSTSNGLLQLSRYCIIFLSFLFCTIPTFATTSVTGNIQDLSGTAVGNGAFVRFYLRGCSGNQPRINGTALIGPTQGATYYKDFVASSSGAISGTLYSTRDVTGLLGGDITCGTSTTGVWYGMTVIIGGKSGPEIPVHALNTATLNISSVTPITTTPVVTAPTGDSTYFRKDAGNSPITGPTALNSSLTVSGAATFINQNGMLHVGPGAYANIAAAIAAAGAVNKTIIVVDSTYAGVDCPALQANLTFFDYRGGSNVCENNQISFNTLSGGGLSSFMRLEHKTNTVTAGGNVSGYFVNLLDTATCTGSCTADGGSGELDVQGTFAGTASVFQGMENAIGVLSTGGAITTVTGAIGYFNSTNGSTTTVGTAQGLFGLGCNTVLGAVPTNCYGVRGAEQTAASGNNFAGFYQGTLYAQSNAGGTSGIIPTINPIKNGALVVGDANVTLGSGTGKIYGVIGATKASGDAGGDKAYGGWFKAGASNVAATEVGLHTETSDTGAILIEAQQGANKATLSSTLPTGTSSFVISPTTTGNLQFQTCGTTSVCAKTNQSILIILNGGPIALSGGTLTITSLPFTSSTSYVCQPDDSTGINGIDVVYVSASSVTFNGTGTDSIRYTCIGN